MIEELLGKRGFNLLLRSKSNNKGQYMGIRGKHFRLKQIRSILLVKAVKKKTMCFFKNHSVFKHIICARGCARYSNLYFTDKKTEI